jgi:undecaprenyl-diphosphatase
MMAFDLLLFHAVNGLAGNHVFLDPIAIFFAEYSQYIWVLVFAGFFDLPKKRIEEFRAMVTLALVAGVVARYGVKILIVLFYERVRPFEALPNVHQLVFLVSDTNQSFPSAHALFFFAIATVLYLFNKKWGLIAFIAALLMGVARVYVGIHYPSDILAGALFGILTGWIVVKVYERTNHSSFIGARALSRRGRSKT